MTGRPVACLICLHGKDLHGARAGRAPEECLYPSCGCPGYVPTERTAEPVPAPQHDRDLYLACQRAFALVREDRASDGYDLLMAEVTRWYQRVTGPLTERAQ